VPDQLRPVEHQGVHATERMLPVVLGHVVEHGVEQRSGFLERGWVEIGGVGCAQAGQGLRPIAT
jgi:hypothetical protein